MSTNQTELKHAIRVAQVEEARWRFFTTYRRHLADCEANQNMLEAVLESRFLPISFENLESVWLSLSPEERSKYSPSTTGEVKPRKAEAETERSDEETAARIAAVVDELGILPLEWTVAKLQGADKDVYKSLYKKYGRDAINDRLAGRS